ncbi:virulence RhuM family protein [Parapedobacter sp. 2B3]|uniref:virulence RhuM family protein n=1 Tax=Parapedobacter sp. 2B3 TaxID=3342381 RepID=UPI0035B6A4E6
MSNIILYETPQGKISVSVRFEDETFWLTQKAMAELFGVEVPAISKHLANIFESGELMQKATVSILEIVQQEGSRKVTRKVEFYNLDAIIAVGYRVNSKQATQFRIWATQTLKEFITKGFVLDDERLKQGKDFGKDHFDELLARIRDIRASEKRFYQKIRDLFMLSDDYDKTDKKTELFFAEVQNKLLFATTQHTAAEIIMQRAKAEELNMGLTSWKGSRVRKEDVIIAKNYLSEDEIDTLNRMVTLFLDTAELRVKEQIPLSIDFWKQEADGVIQFSRKPLLLDKGKVSHEKAKDFAEKQYLIFDSERKKAEALQADLEDQKAIEELLKKVKKK